MIINGPTETATLDDALLQVQKGLKLLTKDAGVKVDRGGTSTSSRYATSAGVYEACHDLLVDNGITLWQGGEVDDKGRERLLTVLAKGGQQRVSSFPILAREGAQNFGGGLAFAKRWGLQAAVGIFTTDDKDERRGDGYDTKGPKRQGPPPGLPAVLADLRAADTCDRFIALASEARGAHPSGEAAASVEKTIEAWFLAAFDAACDAASLDALRATATRVKPRGSSVREAIRTAASRLGAT